MAFSNAWQETKPDNDSYGYEIDDYMRDIRTDLRERLAIQHQIYLDETAKTDIGEHTPGECTVLYAGDKADFPTPSTTSKGCMAIATDEGNQFYYWNGTAWAKIQEPVLIAGNQTIAGNKTFSGIATFSSQAAVFTKGFTAGQDVDIGSYQLRALKFYSDQATGTAPLTVASTTKVTNLNADMVDGKHGDEQFGAWVSRSANTSYLAATDGLVCFCTASSTTWTTGTTDGNNPPTTIRVSGNGGSFFVRKGDYWKAGSGASAVYWLPLGG